MAAIEFWAQVNPDRTLTLPPEVAARLPGDQRVHVVVLVPDDDEPEWTRLAAEQFLNGYTHDDAIYDEQPANGFSPR